jgi:hypothetical protein
MITTAVWTIYTSKSHTVYSEACQSPGRGPRPLPCDPVYLAACHLAPLLPCTPATLPQCLSSAAEGSHVPLRVVVSRPRAVFALLSGAHLLHVCTRTNKGVCTRASSRCW